MFARTSRLLLRPGWPEDAPALYRAVADERIVRNLGTAPWPYALSDAEHFLAKERRAGQSLLIMLRTGDDPALIGAIGCGPGPDGEIELGYWIARPHWGRGYATEAGHGFLSAVRVSLPPARLTAGHFLDNPASGRVLEKLGFRPTGAIVPRYRAGRGREVACRRLVLDWGEEEAMAA